MKIKYLGPGSSVNVAPYDRHEKGEIKEYPDDFGIDLIATSKKQKFEIVEEPAAGDPYEAMTVKEITARIAEYQSIDDLPKMKKAELIECLKKHEAQAEVNAETEGGE
ncbi:MAG: hypothetical protein JRD89_10700 [Deltaproteobacteria bacterium]|nr:hypothetical protein [Deltaproteobacteria bacterium]